MKTKEQVMEEAGIAPTLPTNTSVRTFHARGVPGRDGKGPCRVTKHGVMLPNGDTARPGDTFDPVEERMAPAMLVRLVKLGYIDRPGDELLQRCAEAHKTGYKTKVAPAPEKTKPESPEGKPDPEKTKTKAQKEQAADVQDDPASK